MSDDGVPILHPEAVAPLIEQRRAEIRRKDRILWWAAGSFLVAFLGVAGAVFATYHTEERVLDIAAANRADLNVRANALQANVDELRGILDAVIAALIASQEQVRSLGGTPLPVSIPSTTTSTTVLKG